MKDQFKNEGNDFRFGTDVENSNFLNEAIQLSTNDAFTGNWQFVKLLMP